MLGNREPVEMSEEDAKLITELIENGTWTEGGTPDCASDCVIYLGDEEFLYHSSCGTFADTDFTDHPAYVPGDPNSRGRSMTVSETEQANVNEILEKYIQLGLL